MSGYPSPGSYTNINNNRGPITNGGRYNNSHPSSSDIDSHYSNPYADQKQLQRNNMGYNGVNSHNNNTNNNNNTSNKNDPNNKMAIHRPRLNRKNGTTEPEKHKSSLTTNFDPMKDRHMWAMWRTAVNGRIVDQVRKNEQVKQDALLPPYDYSSAAGESSDGKTTTTNLSTYGKDLASAPPLSRFIRLNQKSKTIAQDLMNEGQGKLETTQFIYYGLPRVTVNPSYNNRYIYGKNSKSLNLDNNNTTNGALNGLNRISHDFDDLNFYNGPPIAHPAQDY